MSSCCRVRPDAFLDVDALVFAQDEAVQSNTARANWLAGLPTVAGLFSTNQGDPTSVIASDYSGIFAGQGNAIDGDWNGIVAGRFNNIADGDEHFIGGGSFNFISAPFSASGIVGGVLNSALDKCSMIAAGNTNIVGVGGAGGNHLAAGGGNTITQFGNAFVTGGGNVVAGGGFIGNGAVVGGNLNTVADGGANAVIAGGSGNVNEGTSSFIGGGANHLIDFGVGFPSLRNGIVAGEGHWIRALTDDAFIGGGSGHTIEFFASRSAIVGGLGHTILTGAVDSFIGGGDPHTISGDRSGIIAGRDHTVDAEDAFVGGGFDHIIPAVARRGAIIGGDRQGFFDADGGGPAGASDMVIVGGSRNFVGDGQSGIVAGTFGTVEKSNSVIAGGFGNYIAQQGGAGDSDFIGGGQSHVIDGAGDANAMIGGIFSDITELPGSGGLNHNAIVGGEFNLIDSASAIGGGHRDSVIVGGEGNRISDVLRSVIAGGTGSVVTDDDSFVCGSASATVGTPRTFAHGLGPADAVGFRGVAPVPAPALAPIPPPTGVPGLDAWIASVDAALKTQGLAV